MPQSKTSLLEKEAKKGSSLAKKFLKAIGLMGLVSAGTGAVTSAKDVAKQQYAPPNVVPPGY